MSCSIQHIDYHCPKEMFENIDKNDESDET